MLDTAAENHVDTAVEEAARRVIANFDERFDGWAAFVDHCLETGWRPSLREDLHGEAARLLRAAMPSAVFFPAAA